MAGATHIFRVALHRRPSVYRDIEIESTHSLYKLAAAIIKAFDFDLDHCFGFYSSASPKTIFSQKPFFELFKDIGEASDGGSVEKTKIAAVFPAVGSEMTFLFDYGDEWLFKVKMTGVGEKAGKVRYPKVITSKGKAPPQYHYPEDEEC